MEINKSLSIWDHPLLIAFGAILLALYSRKLARIELPTYIRDLFNNDIFRVLFLSLVLIRGFNTVPHVALIVSLIFIITFHYVNQQEIRENFEYMQSYRRYLADKKYNQLNY